jgi:arginyl-tRNA synthetase
MREIIEAIQGIVQELFKTEIDVELMRPDEQFGDYATNVALQLGKKLGKNPREVAEAVAPKLHGVSILKATVAGPGFINITLSDQALIELASRQPTKSLAGKTVVAEYSDPNPFKVLHAGHLYTTITGDAIANLLELAGATVHRLNYGGDVGRHVAIAMWAILKELGGENPDKLGSIPAEQRPEWLTKAYVEGNQAFENSESVKAEVTAINKRIYQLHTDSDKMSSFAQIYWTCRQWSYDGFDKLYEQLKISSFEKYVPESEVSVTGVEMVMKGLAEGVFEESDGAVVFRGEPYGLHTRVFLNSQGLPTYEAKDLGLATKKWEDYKFDLSIIITADDIVEYMKVVLVALGHFYPEVVERSKHFTHGVIKLPGGVKMSSRKGNILRAQDILDAAHEANKQLNNQDNDDAVLAAVKYAFLKQRVGGDIIYDPKEAVSILGNSGPYLQYAHARARSILAKGKVEDLPVDNFEADERNLLRKIGEYSEAVETAVADLMPHHICTYLYELAQVFNRFYEGNRVIGDTREKVRLQLVQAYADTLKKGLQILNIPAPPKM